MTYRPVENNLKELLLEAEKLTFNHTIKADGISSVPYANKEKKYMVQFLRLQVMLPLQFSSM